VGRAKQVKAGWPIVVMHLSFFDPSTNDSFPSEFLWDDAPSGSVFFLSLFVLLVDEKDRCTIVSCSFGQLILALQATIRSLDRPSRSRPAGRELQMHPLHL